MPPANRTTSPLSPPAAVLEIAAVLTRAGFETWCVGGAVRDALLGASHLDWDLATAATPKQVRKLFRRTIPVGIEFGTVGVLDAEGTMHEVTTFRRDVRTDGRHAVVEFGASLDDDLARRDFTINAIAYSPSTGEIRDPFGGRADLERRVVRAVGDAAARMREDRLRALRAIRFAARFEFRIEPATWSAIVESAPHLGRLSMERVKQELEKTMEQVACPSVALRLWRESGALRTLVPALAEVSDVTLASLDAIARPAKGARPERRIERLTALLAELPGPGAERAARALRFSNADVAWIGGVVGRWRELEPAIRGALDADAPPSDEVMRRWIGRTGRTRARAVLRLAAARFSGERRTGAEVPGGVPLPARVRSVYRRAIRIAFRDPVEVGDLAVDGDDLRAAGIPPGPTLGKVLLLLLDDVLADPSRNRRDWLLERARAHFERLTGAVRP
ncbi:MAG TPA: CCA tRNA nucleotidyltransferase [Gemmatimonadaceae bacterium]